MKKRIITYRKGIDALLEQPPEETDWNAVRQEHLEQISFFQHERLVHLIVTVTVALLMLLTVLIVYVSGLLPLLMVTAGLMVLLVCYIFHYYTLENEVQKMYGQYDRIVQRCRG